MRFKDFKLLQETLKLHKLLVQTTGIQDFLK